MRELTLEPELRQLLDKGDITRHTALFIQGLPEPERLSLRRLFSCLRFTVNKQREICEWMNDVRHRDAKSMAMVAEALGFDEILQDAELNGPQKSDLLRERLYALRFPELSRYLAGLKERIGRIALPEKVRLVPVSPLEEGEFRLEITFHSEARLKEKLEAVQALMRSDAYREFERFKRDAAPSTGSGPAKAS